MTRIKKRTLSLFTAIIMMVGLMCAMATVESIAVDESKSLFSYDFLFNEHPKYLLTVPSEIKDAKNAYNNVINSYSKGDYLISEVDYLADNFFKIVTKEFLATNFNSSGAKDQLIIAATIDFIQCSIGNNSVNEILLEKVELVEKNFKEIKENINDYKKIKTNKERIEKLNKVLNCFSSKQENQLITYFDNSSLSELNNALAMGNSIINGFDQSLAESAYIISIFEINTIYRNYLNELKSLVPDDSKLYEGLELVSESASTKDPMDMIRAAGLNNIVTNLVSSVFEKSFDKALNNVVSSTGASLIKEIARLTIDIVKNMSGVQDFDVIYKTIYLSSFPVTFEKELDKIYDRYINNHSNVSEEIRKKYKKVYNLYIASIVSTVKNANKMVKNGRTADKNACRDSISELEGFTYETYIRACYNKMAEDGIVDGIIAPDFTFRFKDLTVRTKDDY